MQNLRMEPMQTDENNELSERAFTEFFDIEGGTQPPKSDFIYEPKDGYVRLLQIRDFGQHPVPTYIPLTKKLKLCNKDDILIGRYGASVGKICTGMEGAYNVALTKVVPLKKTDTRYIYHLLNSNYFQSQLRRIERSAQNGFNKDDLSSISLPVIENYDYQMKISRKLDVLITDVKNSKVKIEAAKKIIAKFRQAILTAAITGKLTEEWRAKNGEYNWGETTLENVITDKPRNGYSPKPVDYPTKVKSLALSATTSGIFKPEHFKYIDEEISENSHLWLKPGDILIQRANSYELVGVSAIYSGKEKEFIYPDLMMKVQPNAKIIGEFLYYVLSCTQTRSYFKHNSTGTSGNMPKINQGTVMNVPLLLPSLDEQKEIVKRVGSYFEVAKKVEEQVEKAEGKVSKLTQAILAKTFRQYEDK